MTSGALFLLPVGAGLWRGLRCGIDALHLGVIFAARLEPRFLHSSVGVNLFLASHRMRQPLGDLVRTLQWIGSGVRP